MARPRGRPKEPNPLAQVITFRLSQDEYEQLQRLAYQHRPILSPTELARELIRAELAKRSPAHLLKEHPSGTQGY